MGSTPIQGAMKTKHCFGCNTTKPVSEFHNRSKARDGLQTQCKDCKAAHHAEYYPKNKELFRKHLRKSRSVRAARYAALKNKPCMDCGQTFPSFVMDFHHRSDKLFDVGHAYALGWSMEKIESEAQKCDLVCANCHRLRTYGSGERVGAG